jgi:prefoldin alpha subunit
LSASSNQSGDTEDQMRKLMGEYRTLEGTAKVFQGRLEILSGALNEIISASLTLQGLRDLKDKEEALVPIGSGSFIRGSLTDTNKAIIGVGAGICIEKPLEEAIHDFKGRQGELERTITSIQEQLAKVLNELEGRRRIISSYAQKSGGVVRTT